MRWREPVARSCARLLLQRKRVPELDDLTALRRCLSTTAPELAYEEIPAPRTPTDPSNASAAAPRTAILLHGLLGSGRNWRTWTRKLVTELDQRPGADLSRPWRFILVDLRHHGQSAEVALDPPTSIRSAAEDVVRLVHHSPWRISGAPAEGSPQGQGGGAAVVIGHSVGGKVALEYARLCTEAADAGAQGSGTFVAPPQQVWVLDSVPGSLRSPVPRGQASGPSTDEGDDVSKVLRMLLSLQRPVPSRRWLVQEVQRRGFSEGLAEWLGSSLRTLAKDSLDFQFDLPGALDLYSSYRSTDLFPFVESGATGDTVLHFVRAANSDRWTPSILERLDRAVSSRPETVKLHLLPDAGHWLHVDNPQGLSNLMAPVLAKV